jgi:hypothetical protein
MDLADQFVFAAAALFIIYGVAGLIATWVFPRLQGLWPFKPWMLTGPLEANDTNRTIMSLLVLFFGLATAFSITGHVAIGSVALGLLIVVVVLKKVLATRRPDA